MKLKYYLNGFGIGVIFATVILSVSFYINRNANRTVMNDTQIIERARELGMEFVEEESTAETETVETSKQNEASGDDDTEEITTTENETTSEVTTEESTSPQETTEEVTAPTQTTENETVPQTTTASSDSNLQNSENASITINSGMGSESVASALKQAGIIEDTSSFNSYIVGQGYASRIKAGTFEIPVGADFDTILGIICR